MGDQCTLGPANNEFGYNEHPAITSRFLCIKVIDCSVKKFGYNGHPFITSSFFCIVIFVVSATQCLPIRLAMSSVIETCLPNIFSVRNVVGSPVGRHLGSRHPPRWQTPPPCWQTPAREAYCSRRYASYWNAFL